MTASLGTLLDRLQGFFSKSFFLVGWLPVIAFLALNALLVVAVFPSAREAISLLANLEATDQALNWLGVLLLSFILGQVLWSVNPWLRQFMEGRYLPAWVQEQLEKIQNRELDQLIQERKEWNRKVYLYRKAQQLESPSNWIVLLREARQDGENKPASPISTTLTAHYDALADLRLEWQEIPYSEMKALFDELEQELKTKPASKVDRLDEIHVGFITLLEYARQRVEIPWEKVLTELKQRFPQGKLGPSRLANLVEVHREYGLEKYGLDIELMWLRMLKLVQADDHFSPILENAKTQLDFSVAVTALLALFTLIWLPLSLLAPTPIPYLLIAAIGPPVTFIFYRIVLQNYRAFTEVVNSAFDLYRFDLLEALHIPLPKDSRAERELWKQIMAWPVGEGEAPIRYQHKNHKDTEEDDHPGIWQRFWTKLKKLVGWK